MADEKINNLEADSLLGHYRILKKIGAGGMGEVFLAEDTLLERRVALKVLPEDLAGDADRMRRFVQEAKATSALNHPNILTIYEIGESENTNYIAAEYVEGETLRERLRGEPLNLKSALDVAVQITSALQAAHGAGVVHRDIKPDNVMIRPDGLAKLLDFGIAKLTEKKTEPIDAEAVTAIEAHTKTGMIIGTAAYMSPEQASGKAVDARSDIFSFGLVLYEMLSGRAAFKGANAMETIGLILHTEPVPLGQQVPDVPHEIERIVGKALRKDCEERYQTAKDLLIDLKDVRQELEFQNKLERTNPPHREDPKTQMMHVLTTDASQLAKRKRILLKTALALGVVAVAAVSLWFFFGRQNSFTAIGVQKTTQLTIWSGLDDFPSMSPDGNSVAYCSNHSGSFEIYVKALTAGAKEVQLTNDGKQNFEPAWSPDGQRIAYYSKLRGGIWVIPASGGEAKQLTEFGSHPAWSPDGKQIVFQSNPLNDLGAFARNALPPSTLWLVSANGSEPKQLTQIGNPQGGHGSPAWSPDGKGIAFEADTFYDASIWTVSLNGDNAKRVSPETKGGYAPVYAPDGQSIFYHSGDVFQLRINSNTGEPVGEPIQIAAIAARPSVIRRISFSADGKKIAFNIMRRSESISSVTLKANSAEANDTPIELISNATGRNNYPAFSPDGKRLAFSSCSTGGAGCDIWLANTDGSNQIQLTTAESSELLPGWFPNGGQIAYTSDRTGYRTYWAIDLNTKRERQVFDFKETLDYVRLSPDGKQILFNLIKDGVINVWSAPLHGGEPKQLTFDKEMMGFPTWSPDGKYIALQIKRGDDTHVMIMPSEGGMPVQLTFDKGQSWIYGWSPDGDKILFAGQRDGFWNAWWVSRSTKKQQQLTDYKKLNSFVRYPAWSPKGDQIAYEYSETTGNIWVADLK